MKRRGKAPTFPSQWPTSIEAPRRGKFVKAITFLRAEKSKDQYKYTPGGRERRRTRPVPSLPKLNFSDGPPQA